mmetsp:Transcript_3089/g.4319  ORF Transcript_3089/g.4319 Transcript_3089/m.4319 type:complete len:266 (+) Transcript_3089:977-1774(+)
MSSLNFLSPIRNKLTLPTLCRFVVKELGVLTSSFPSIVVLGRKMSHLATSVFVHHTVVMITRVYQEHPFVVTSPITKHIFPETVKIKCDYLGLKMFRENCELDSTSPSIWVHNTLLIQVARASQNGVIVCVRISCNHVCNDLSKCLRSTDVDIFHFRKHIYDAMEQTAVITRLCYFLHHSSGFRDIWWVLPTTSLLCFRNVVTILVFQLHHKDGISIVHKSSQFGFCSFGDQFFRRESRRKNLQCRRQACFQMNQILKLAPLHSW